MKGAVVLIHGLFGDLESWGNTDEFLQRALGSDYDVVKYPYQSNAWGRNPSINEIAILLGAWLDTRYPVTEYPDLKLFLAGHSMGGLVAKEYILSILRRGRAEELRVKGIVLAAVPNLGAEAAEIARRLPIVGGIQINELRPRKWSAIKQFFGFSYTSTFVAKQHKCWIGRINSTDPYFGPTGKASIDVLVFYAVGDEVVDRESATAAQLGAIPLPGTHTTIVKPSTEDDQIIKSIGAFIRGVREEEPFVASPMSLPTKRIHYVDPGTAFNVHYARFELRLRQTAYAAEIDVQHHIPADDDPEHALDLLGRLLTSTPSDQPIILIPRQFGSTNTTEDRTKSLVRQQEERHIIFVDHDPPRSIRNLANVSYVGPDNWLIGSLGALALAAHLRSAGSENFPILTIKGPGGQRRCDGFVDTAEVKRLGLTSLEPVEVGDLDRLDTAMLIRDLVRDKKHKIVAGFFAGNDETAASFVDAIEDYGHSSIVVGCDGTREMRQLTWRGGTALVDTVLTHPGEQAREVVRLVSGHHLGMQRYRRPSLERYEYDAGRMIEQCEELRDWWPATPTDWYDQMCGPTST